MPHIDPRIFPTVLIALDWLAAIIWMTHGNIRQTIYWIAAGVLTFTVTW